MARLTIDQLCNFFRYYEDLPHQRLAVAELVEVDAGQFAGG